MTGEFCCPMMKSIYTCICIYIHERSRFSRCTAPNTQIITDLTPFAKSNVRCFPDTKINMMPSPNLYDFWWVHKMHALTWGDRRDRVSISLKHWRDIYLDFRWPHQYLCNMNIDRNMLFSYDTINSCCTKRQKTAFVVMNLIKFSRNHSFTKIRMKI